MRTLQALDPALRACLQVSAFPLAMMFGVCSLFLLLAAVCQHLLAAILPAQAVKYSPLDSYSEALQPVKTVE